MLRQSSGVVANVKEGIVSTKYTEAVAKMKQAVLCLQPRTITSSSVIANGAEEYQAEELEPFPAQNDLPALFFESYFKYFWNHLSTLR